MNGRRRESRFLPSVPWNASLTTSEDVVLTRVTGQEILALSDRVGRRGDELTLQIATGGLQLDVRVMNSEPVVGDSGVRQQLLLRVCGSDDYRSDGPARASR